MEILPIALLLFANVALQVQCSSLQNSLIALKNIQKRAAPSKNRADQFVEEKLIEHSRALEHLVNLVEENGQLTKQLVENLSRQISTPKLPERIGISRAAKHTNESDDEDDSNVLSTRRTFNKKQTLVDDFSRKLKPWCFLSLLCVKTHKPVCGYDDIFGYGAFEDVCHMFHVNCYWQYNFTLASSCSPYSSKK